MPPPKPSIRAITLYTSRWVDQTVRITGQYSGRNLFGELPDAPNGWGLLLLSLLSFAFALRALLFGRG